MEKEVNKEFWACDDIDNIEKSQKALREINLEKAKKVLSDIDAEKSQKALSDNSAEKQQKPANALKVLFEDNHIIVVVKPQNVASAPDSSGDVSLLDMVKAYIKEKYAKPGNVFVGLVHRLDRPTGGVMVFAKTSKAASRLSEQIREGDIEKKYLAVVCGVPLDRRARLTNYLLKNEEQNTVKVVQAKEEGAKLAVLDYNVLEMVENHSLVDIKLITGRSHQARVQMKYINCPIYGDAKYGDGNKDNLALWAYQLSFNHPTSKQPYVFKVFPPKEDMPWKPFNIEKYINVVRPE